jgi:Telomeric single stranded DNA binding POT1/CDC13
LSCIALVLDATGAYKTFDSTDYVTRLKIIDPTYNYTTETQDYKKYVHVFIFTEKFSEAPRVPRVGDIIKLKNYNVILLI